MESTQRSILRCAHGRACPDMFHCRRDHGERASAQRAAAEAKEKAAAERRAAEEQEKERTHREKMARMELQRLKAVERARRAAARVAAATLPVPVAAMAAAVAVVAAPAAAPVPAIIQPNAPVPGAAAGPAGAAPAAVNVAPTVPAAGAPPVAPVDPTVAVAAVPAASVASTDAPEDAFPRRTSFPRRVLPLPNGRTARTLRKTSGSRRPLRVRALPVANLMGSFRRGAVRLLPRRRLRPVVSPACPPLLCPPPLRLLRVRVWQALLLSVYRLLSLLRVPQGRRAFGCPLAPRRPLRARPTRPNSNARPRLPRGAGSPFARGEPASKVLAGVPGRAVMVARLCT